MSVLMQECVCQDVFVCRLFLPSGGFNRGGYSFAFYMTQGHAALACLLRSDHRLKLEHRKRLRVLICVCLQACVTHYKHIPTRLILTLPPDCRPHTGCATIWEKPSFCGERKRKEGSACFRQEGILWVLDVEFKWIHRCLKERGEETREYTVADSIRVCIIGWTCDPTSVWKHVY